MARNASTNRKPKKSTHSVLSNKVLKNIKTKKVVPKPKWEFLLKNWVMWGFAGITLVLGALSTGITMHLLQNNDWDLHKDLNQGFAEFIVKTLPHVWLVLFIFFLIAAIYNFRHTKKGYKLPPAKTILLGLTIVLLGGVAFAGTGLAERAEDRAYKHIPHYQKLQQRQAKQIWHNPEKGLLGGEISEIEDRTHIILIDVEGNKWNVIIPTPQEMHFPKELPEFQKQKIIKRAPKLIKVENMIKLKGEISGDYEFTAIHFRPWDRRPAQFIKKVKEKNSPVRTNR